MTVGGEGTARRRSVYRPKVHCGPTRSLQTASDAVDYVGLAKSLGVPGELVEKTADVGPAMKRGLDSGGPYLIDARIDGSFKG